MMTVHGDLIGNLCQSISTKWLFDEITPCIKFLVSNLQQVKRNTDKKTDRMKNFNFIHKIF